MPKKKILRDELINREVDTLRIFLKFKALKTSLTLEEFVETARSQGQPIEFIRETLIKDLQEGGRIFGEFRNSIRATANGTINRLRDTGEFSEFGIEKQFRWAAVLVKTCPDCIERHNMEPRSWEEWEEMGLPRTGATVCKENCRCMLIPAEFTVLKPLVRAGRN